MKNSNIASIGGGSLMAGIMQSLHNIDYLAIIISAILGAVISFLISKLMHKLWKKLIENK